MSGRINPKKCNHCGVNCTPEGHDGCIGELPYPVMNACCGHGNDLLAYVQLDHANYSGEPNKHLLTGSEAIGYIFRLADTKEASPMTNKTPEMIWFNDAALSEHMYVSTIPFAGGRPFVPADLSDAKDKRIAELEAKLAKLVEVLKGEEDRGHCLSPKADATLAALQNTTATRG